MGGARKWLPDRSILMTTEAYLPDGNIARGEETVLVAEEDDENYYGLCFYKGRIIEGVRFPKKKTRVLTKQEKNELWIASYHGAIFS